MNLEDRKKKFIENFLKIENEKLISQLENILISESNKLDTLEELNINEFKELCEDAQIEYISDLEFEEDATFKWSLFSRVLEDKTISDLTRIEILNVLGANDIPQNFKSNFIEIILKYFEERDEDDTFLSHCVMALQNQDLFSEKVYDKVLEIFLNDKEDIDIRYNANIIIIDNTKKEKLIEYYEKFIGNSDPVFSERSKKWIEEIKQELENTNEE